MSVLLPAPRAVVRLVLDTHPPVLAIQGEPVVQPPSPLHAVVVADEPVSAVEGWFEDNGGTRVPFGVDYTVPTRVVLDVPTAGLGSGPGLVHLVAYDLACNAVALDWPVILDRPRLFDLTAATRRSYEMAGLPNGGFQTRLATGHALDLAIGDNQAFEVQAGPASAFDLRTEITGG